MRERVSELRAREGHFPQHTGSDSTPEMDQVMPESGELEVGPCGRLVLANQSSITKCEKPKGHTGPHVGDARPR